ncbi:purine nucleoside phosphorylase-like, partial [Scleropages formosus]
MGGREASVMTSSVVPCEPVDSLRDPGHVCALRDAGDTAVNLSCYEECKSTAEWLLAQMEVRPLLGIVCGSGLGGLAEMLKDQVVFRYEDIPNFPQSTVRGHAGRLVFGTLKGKPCVCMQGRFHLYEGYPVQKTTLPMRIFKLLGVEMVILTNAAGGLNEDYKECDSCRYVTVILSSRFGVRFPCMSDAYDRDLRQLAQDVGEELGYKDFLREGVYCVLGGPSYETIAECRMLHRLGADAAVMDYNSEEKANHEEVLQTGKQRAEQLEELVSTMVARIEHNNNS